MNILQKAKIRKANQLHFFVSIFSLLFLFFISLPMYIGLTGFFESTIRLQFFLIIILGISVFSAACSFLVYCVDKYIYMFIPIIALLLFTFTRGVICPSSAAGQMAGIQTAGWLSGSLTSYCILFGGLAASLLMTYIFREKLRYIAIMILIFSIIMTVYSIIKHSSFTPESQHNSLDSLFPFNTEYNIIYLGVDGMEGSIIESIVKENPDILNEFNGFTLFPHTVSTYGHTIFSLPVILTGRLWNNFQHESVYDYFQKAIADSFLTDVADEGFNVTDLSISSISRKGNHNIAEKLGERYAFYNHAMLSEADWLTWSYWKYIHLLDSTCARILGFWVHLPLPDPMSVIPAFLGTWQKIYKQLPNYIRVSEQAAPHILASWDASIHPPIVFDQLGNILQQPKYDVAAARDTHIYILSEISRLLQDLKRIGIYDNTLILIGSDHGQYYAGGNRKFYNSIPGFEDGAVRYGNYLPLNLYNVSLFIKPVKSQGKAQLSYEPVWNGDVRAIINYYTKYRKNISPENVIKEIRVRNPIIPVAYKGVKQDASTHLERAAYNHFIIYDYSYVHTPSLETLGASFKKEAERGLCYADYKLGEDFISRIQACQCTYGWLGTKLEAEDVSLIHLRIIPPPTPEKTIKLSILLQNNSNEILDISRTQSVDIIVNNTFVASNMLLSPGSNEINITIPTDCIKSDGTVALEFNTHTKFNLDDAGIHNPTFKLQSLKITEQ
jgi:hypothetical protein